MGELTADKPKCQTMLCGTPLLDWQLASLREAGITDVTVIRGYRKELLCDGRFAVLDNDAWAETNMVATLCCAASLLKERPCIVSYSDIVYHPDIVRALAASDGDIVISYDVHWEELWSARFEDVLVDAETFRQQDGKLIAIGGRAKTLSEIEGQYMGLLKFSPNGWSYVERHLDSLPQSIRNRLDMTSLLKGLLDEGVEIRCVPIQGRWCEVDSESDARAYEQLLEKARSNNTRWRHDWQWRP
jgi:L-glutamine-phosphate cytidylyltransferase